MTRYLGAIAPAAAALIILGALGATVAYARDTTFQMRNQQSFFVKRYPGDQAFAGGTVRMQGPEKGPYIERCHWTAKPGIFGLPFGFTQSCYRHTLENTPE